MPNTHGMVVGDAYAVIVADHYGVKRDRPHRPKNEAMFFMTFGVYAGTFKRDGVEYAKLQNSIPVDREGRMVEAYPREYNRLIVSDIVEVRSIGWRHHGSKEGEKSKA